MIWHVCFTILKKSSFCFTFYIIICFSWYIFFSKNNKTINKNVYYFVFEVWVVNFCDIGELSHLKSFHIFFSSYTSKINNNNIILIKTINPKMQSWIKYFQCSTFLSKFFNFFFYIEDFWYIYIWWTFLFSIKSTDKKHVNKLD